MGHGDSTAILACNAVVTSARPHLYATCSIAKPGLRSKIFIATNSRRPATATQLAILELLEQVTRKIVVADSQEKQCTNLKVL